ncbi:MAG: hypothetical protein ACRYG4_04145 [Janthinobacterium lividum]
MAKKLGNDYRLWIEGATPGTLAEIKGQQDLSQAGQASTIDISDKTNAPYGLTAPGNIDVSISGDLFPDLPDATGYALLAAAFLSQTVVKFEIRKGGSLGASPGDVVFAASMYVLQNGKSYPKGGVVKATIALGLALAPTVNLLA